MFLLDTMIVSELRKQRPDAGVEHWLTEQPEHTLFLSVVTLGEIERSIEKKRAIAPKFVGELDIWLERLTQLYADRLLPITPAIARRWGQLSAQLKHSGADLMLAATAHLHNLTVVTRNSDDFQPTGVRIINPYAC